MPGSTDRPDSPAPPTVKPSAPHGREPAAESPPQDQRERFSLNLSTAQIIGSALASMTAAIGASFFGVAGTILGAAFGSIVSTIGGALYVNSLQHAGTRIREAAPTQRLTAGMPLPFDRPHIVTGPASRRAGSQPTPDPSATYRPDDTVIMPTVPAEATAPAEVTVPAERARGIGTHWKALVAVSVGAFALAIGVITGVEALTGESISRGDDSRTTIGSVVGGGTASVPDPAPSSTPASTPATSSPSTTASPSTGASVSPTDTASANPTTTVTVTATPTTGTSPTTGPTPAPTAPASQPSAVPTTP